MTVVDEQSRKPQYTTVVGLQWGDEAKGKIVDILGEHHHFVVRYNGGANAGHTVVRGGKTYKFSLLPTGVLRPNVISVIGNGVVVNPIKFLEEVNTLREAGINLDKKILLSDRAHLIFPYHLEEDRLNEEPEQAKPIGTTGRGIGPCYQDKVGRTCGIRVGELLFPGQFAERLQEIVPRKNRILKALSSQAQQFNAEDLIREYLGYAEKLKPYIADTCAILNRAVDNRQSILFEGAQGSLLDVDHGTYPYVTSSSSCTAGVWSGSGVSARNLTKVLGVLKAYTTRVGKGAFPTELEDGPDGIGERIRRVGKEYGTVTGRPRRCGWFDAVATRYTAKLGGVDVLSIMLLDVLSGISELKICTGYLVDGKKLEHFPANHHVLENCQPEYETLPGWDAPIDKLRNFKDFPLEARQYVARIGELLNLPVKVVSVGPDHEQTVFCS